MHRLWRCGSKEDGSMVPHIRSGRVEDLLVEKDKSISQKNPIVDEALAANGEQLV